MGILDSLFGKKDKSANSSEVFEYELKDGFVTIKKYLGDKIDIDKYIRNKKIKQLLIEIPAMLDGHPVTEIGKEAFISSNFSAVTIPNSVISIGENAFQGCYGLTSVNIPNSVTSIGVGAFSYCINLQSVNLPETVTTIKPSAFNNCKKLTSIIIPNKVNEVANLLFCECQSLINVTLHNSITRIGSSSFKNCKALRELIIPDSVTEIVPEAFNGCSLLKDIKLPESLNGMNPHALFGRDVEFSEMLKKIEQGKEARHIEETMRSQAIMGRCGKKNTCPYCPIYGKCNKAIKL